MCVFWGERINVSCLSVKHNTASGVLCRTSATLGVWERNECPMTTIRYSQEGSKNISISWVNLSLILTKCLWKRSNHHLTKPANLQLSRESKPLTQLDSRKKNGCSQSDWSHRARNYLNDIQVLLMITVWLSCSQEVPLLLWQCQCIIFLFSYTVPVLLFICVCISTR